MNQIQHNLQYDSASLNGLVAVLSSQLGVQRKLSIPSDTKTVPHPHVPTPAQLRIKNHTLGWSYLEENIEAFCILMPAIGQV